MRPLLSEVLVSIAGYDPSGGAGVLLDIGVFRHFGFRGAGLLTAVTAQNSRRIASIRCLDGRFLRQQHDTLVREVSPAGIKVGMLGSRRNLAALAIILARHRGRPVVVDPVLRSSSGRWLLEKAAVADYLDRIKGRITILTPNLHEAALISGVQLRRPQDMKEAARRIVDRVAAPCLIKGGHLSGKVVDGLYDGERYFLFPHARIRKDIHGTGCFLSSSLLCFLVMSKPLVEACSQAIDFTQEAMKKTIRPGKGRAVFSEY